MGGVGVAGLAVGSVAGILTLGHKSTVNDNCNADTKQCNAAGYDAAQSGKTLGLVTTTGLVVGAVGVGIGAYLLLSNGKGESHTAVTAGWMGGAHRRFFGATLVASDGEHPKGWTFAVHRRT